MIQIPEELIAQLPLAAKKLDHLYQEFGGIPLPFAPGVLDEALDLVEIVEVSPVIDAATKEQAKAWKAELIENSDDWARLRKTQGPNSPLYDILASMNEEIRTLRHDMKCVLERLDELDQARFNQARRLVGLPPMRGHHSFARERQSGFSTPTKIERLNIEQLCETLERYLGEYVSEDLPRDSLVKAIQLCSGVDPTI